MIDFRPFLGTAVIHAIGSILIAASMPTLGLAARPKAICACVRPITIEVEPHPPCPGGPAVVTKSVPDFPLTGFGRPFSWLHPVGENPEICVLVEHDGSVGEAFIAQSSGSPSIDRVLLGSTRELRFTPARNSKRQVASWGRLVVHRQFEFSWWLPTSADTGPTVSSSKA